MGLPCTAELPLRFWESRNLCGEPSRRTGTSAAATTVDQIITVWITARSFLFALNALSPSRLELRSLRTSSLPSRRSQECSSACLAVSRVLGLISKRPLIKSCGESKTKQVPGRGGVCTRGMIPMVRDGEWVDRPFY